MSCGSCGKTFGWFSKEMGCVKCNRLFCKKCLVHKIQSEDKKQTFLVCLRCYSLKSEPNDLSRNKISKQKVEELLEVKPNEFSEPVLEPSTATDDIRARLDNLKEKNNATDKIDNDDEIQQRLADLKGVKLKPEKSATFSPADTRSDQEKIEDLLKQFVEEKDIIDQHDDTAIPSSSGSIDDIEKRLAALRGVDLSKIKAPLEDFVEETEKEEIDRNVMKYLEEAKLPEFALDPDEQELMSSIPLPPGVDKKDLEELPFCEICNEDAVLRCLECENIFCHRCFLEFHDEEDYKTHKTKPYEAPKIRED